MKPDLIVLAALAAVLTGCGSTDESASAKSAPAVQLQPGEVVLPADSPKLRQIKVERVTEADVPSDELGSPGKVEANPNRLAHVLLPLPGRVTKVFVKLGDAVRQGQPLLALESPDADMAMSNYLQTTAGVTQAKAGFAKAQADLDRTRDLYENNAVAKKELLNADAMLTQSKAGVDQAEAAVQNAVRRLEILGLKPGLFGQHVELRAPVSGKVLEMTVVPGEYRNDTNNQVLLIADLSTVWVTSDVPESSIRLVRNGERVDIELAAYPGELFRGRVTQIADIVDPQTRTIKVRAEMQNPGGRLRPEMFARIRLVGSTSPKPVVPIAAVVQGEAGTFVMREVAPGSFRQTPVTLGPKLGDRVAISKGLNRGDRVVTDGVLLVRN